MTGSEMDRFYRDRLLAVAVLVCFALCIVGWIVYEAAFAPRTVCVRTERVPCIIGGGKYGGGYLKPCDVCAEYGEVPR